ncbi:aldo/keto reductase [Leeuwenhoekiella parthenopeia]|uniref:Aldo/keto reductase n=1 Tax=Leeuwenhoekiella parthenopeia TaxID=2890320 RepID=A0ABS8GSU2_9FLAO|nr:aldo/keto reductase [Leeuwenhoekiella parthenopeia]MCC4213065.1 aldo/keto reductase [Leeuwenhoekiella parthenopeia]
MKIKKTITIGADTKNPLTVKRLGYGTMRLTGEHVWGEPENRVEALEILKATSENGIQFLDTADYYGADVTNRLIAEALHPYKNDLVICTKVGADRGADKSWRAFDKPENLRTSIDTNLKTLKIEQMQLVHFRVMPDSVTPFEESLNTMFEIQKEGKILHVGLSNVNEEELNTALNMGSIASVENAFGYEQRTTFSVYGQEVRGMQEVMEICNENRIPMIPFFSLQSSLPNTENKIAEVAKKYNTTAAQLNLAWLLHYNDLILPIPGTSKLSHFKENSEAFNIALSEEDMAFLG